MTATTERLGPLPASLSALPLACWLRHHGIPVLAAHSENPEVLVLDVATRDDADDAVRCLNGRGDIGGASRASCAPWPVFVRRSA